MSKKFNTIYSILGLLLFAYIFMSYSANPPNGKTGAPGDSLCTDCHNSNVGNYQGDISISGIPTSISPNTSYTVTVTSSYSGLAPSRTGFQLVALDANDQNTGTLSNTDNNSTITAHNNRNYVEHNPAQSFGTNSAVTWTFDWESPAANDGDVITFYYASILGNGSGSSGDNMLNSSFQTTISSPAKPIANAGGQANLVCGFPTAGLNGQFSSQGPNYTYQWTGPSIVSGADTAFPTVDMPGKYTLVVTDITNGCTASDCTEVVDDRTPPDVMVAAPQGNVITCSSTSVALEASSSDPNVTFLWEGPNNLFIGGASIEAIEAGTYLVTASSNNGCEEMASIEVLEMIESPDADAGPDVQLTATCDMSSTLVTLMGSSSTANASYFWVTADGNIVSGETTLTPQVDAMGIYTLTVTDNTNGCTASDEVAVFIDGSNPNLPVAMAEVSGSVCQGTNSSFTLDASASSNYTDIMWTGPNGFTSTDIVVQVTEPGTYTLTASDAATGCIAELIVEVEQSTLITANATAVILCPGDDPEIDIDISGTNPPYDINWVLNNDGTIDIIVTDALGCEETTSLMVQEPERITQDVTITGESSAGNDGAITINTTLGGTPPYTIMPMDLTNLTAGDYTITVTDANGCVETFTYTVGMLTSINDPVLTNQIQLLPNPSQGLLTLQMDLNSSNNVQLEVYDFTGQFILSEKLGASQMTQQMDWQHLTKGIYFVKIQIGEDIVTKKLLIQ